MRGASEDDESEGDGDNHGSGKGEGEGKGEGDDFCMMQVTRGRAITEFWPPIKAVRGVFPTKCNCATYTK